ncbi:outer membrane protein [Catalinimonas alkaloidigena]|uniref:OmpH family outer membrane protein n=1 Tax=Catalinimonas alkaloidigena TaxID=1075417 RepID=UPI002404DE12|nr:OmpH family outer membrane protein [Catalinimonas alkaloidigena]MDF9795406.1 outer membrane protein [Catalinimonas alkaloidigena]
MMIKKTVFTLLFVIASLTTFAQVKIAFAEVNYILNQLPETQTIDTQLQAFETQLSSEIQTMSQQFQQSVQEYQSSSGTMTDEAKATKEGELQTLQQQIQQKQQEAQQKLQQRYAELLGPVRDKVMNAIETVAEANGYTHVFAKSISGNLIAVYPDVQDNSFSDMVLQELGVTVE